MYALAKGGGVVGSAGLLSSSLQYLSVFCRDHQHNLQDTFIRIKQFVD